MPRINGNKSIEIILFFQIVFIRVFDYLALACACVGVFLLPFFRFVYIHLILTNVACNWFSHFFCLLIVVFIKMSVWRDEIMKNTPPNHYKVELFYGPHRPRDWATLAGMYVCACVCICAYVCMCVCAYVGVYMGVHVRGYVCVVCLRITTKWSSSMDHIDPATGPHLLVCTCVHVCACACICVHVRMCVYACVHGSGMCT